MKSKTSVSRKLRMVCSILGYGSDIWSVLIVDKFFMSLKNYLKYLLFNFQYEIIFLFIMAGFHNDVLTLATYKITKINIVKLQFYNTVDIFVLASHSVVPDRAAHRCRWFLSMSSCRPHNMQKGLSR